MTDSILRSYQAYSYTSIVPFPVAVAALTGANLLLTDETQGFAIDATTAGGTVAVIDTGSPGNNLSNVAISASNLVQAGTSAKVVIWNDGTLHTIASGQIAQQYDSALAKFGMLIEPAATNLALRSEDFSTTWVQTDTTRTSTNNAAPNTALTATLMTEGSAGTASNKQAITITANGTYIVSTYLKKGNTDVLRLGLYETATPTNRIDRWFNLNTGALGSAAIGGTGTGADGSITSIDGSWYRCSLSGAVGNSATAVTLDMSSASADSSATRVNGATYQVWGEQAETGTYASSYITTTTVPVTRAVDQVYNLVSSIPFDTTKGTVYMDFKCPLAKNSNQQLWSFYNAGVDDKLIEGYISDFTPTPDNQSFMFVYNGGVQADFSAGAVLASDNARHQMTAAWAANDFDASIDGGAAQTDVAGSIPTGMNRYGIGHEDGVASIAGLIYRVVYVPRQVETDANNIETWRYNY